MSLQKIQHLLEGEIGINPDSLSENSWKFCLEERMQAVKIADEEAYLAHLIASLPEKKAFIEGLVVPETWFFRHREAFTYLRYLVHEVWSRQTHRKEPLRILSLPCSTGEEPYSIAMTLFEAGVPGAWFHVDAVDISEKLLDIAREGVYGNYAFRGLLEEERSHFFMKEKNRFRILDLVKQQVRFFQGNIADIHLLHDEKPYDVIFCRNLFIYLKPKALECAKRTLGRLLKEDGVLFVSPVEAQLAVEWGFSGAGPFGSAAFSRKKIVEKSKNEPKTGVLLADAKLMINTGLLEQAYKNCFEYVSRNTADPEGHFLLGVIEHARGNNYNAEKRFRKALYLAPTNQEAMIYLALIAEARGDAAEAQKMRQRAAR